MTPTKQRLGAILKDDGQLTVPMYQRQYSWDEEDVRIFWNDLVEISQQDDGTHYVGTMVTQKGEPMHGGIENEIIIDGQQRITVLMLLAAAMRDAIRFDPALSKAIQEKKSLAVRQRRDADERLKQLHLDLLLKDAYLFNESDGKNFKKFIPTELNYDRDVFNSVVYEGKADGRKRHYRHYTVLKNAVAEYAGIPRNDLELSRERTSADIEAAVSKLNAILDGLFRMELVYIQLGHTDDPQQIFESINHKGVDLSATDLIRNHILSIGGEAGKYSMFESIWKPIENSLCMLRQKNEGVLRKALFDGFFRSYMGMKGKVVPGKKLYSELRNVLAYDIAESDNVPARVAKLKPFSEYAASYEALSYSSCDRLSEELRGYVDRFSRLDFSVPMSLMLKFYGNTNHPRDQDVGASFRVLENYFVRRALLGKPVKEMSEFFARLSLQYDPNQVNHDAFPQWLTDKLITESAGVFGELKPISDSVLQDEIKRARVYANSRNATRFALSTLETHISSGVIVEDLHDFDIEHVLPQEHTNHWMDDLIKWHSGMADFPKDQNPASLRKKAEAWVNDRVDLHRDTLGNLTLTSFNRSLSNFSFVTKRDYQNGDKDKGYKTCNIQLTRRDFKELDKWTFAQIEQRSLDLCKELIKIYPELKHSSEIVISG